LSRARRLSAIRILSNKKPQPCAQAAKVLAGGGEHGVDGVAAGVGKVIAAHAVVFLEVADDGFDGRGKLLAVLRQVRPVSAPGVLDPLAVLFGITRSSCPTGQRVR
jgi:hypothetical protein